LIHVVAGVLIDRRRRVLIAQRPAGKHMAGAWEFPGGKLEPGEAPAEGLKRELDEEIGVSIERPRPLMRLRHRYAYGEVLLDIWVVRRYRGEPRSLDGQALRWCSRPELANADLLPADRPIIAGLSLPERLRRHSAAGYRITPFAAHREGDGRRLEGVLCGSRAEAETAAAAGADFLALGKPMAPNELGELCKLVGAPVYARGLDLERAWSLGATGINALTR
jgi:mutator protein MutT